MRTTIHEVAQAAGVSIATVSRALNGRGRISKATRLRVLQTAQDLGYQPNDLARSLLAKTTQTIAVIVPDITNPFFPELIKGIEQVACARGHLVLLCDSADDKIRVWKDLAALRRKQVDGIILVGARLSADRIAAVTAGLPVVTVDRDVQLSSASVVQSDHRSGAALATDYLLALGHRRIAYLTGTPGLTVTALRLAGYEAALAQAGLLVDQSLVVSAGFLEEEGHQAARELLSRATDFTAVLAANDLSAIGALAALEEAGLRVPADVSVMGFDDIHLASYIRPRLSTVRQHIFRLGARAAEVLIDQLVTVGSTQIVHETMEVELVVRESTAPPPGGSNSELKRGAAHG